MNFKSYILALLTVFAIFNTTTYVNAQSLKPREEKKIVRKGRKAFNKQQYSQAKGYYDKVTNSGSTNSQYWFEAGMLYFDSKVDMEQSVPLLEKALELSHEDTIPEIFLYLGHAYHYVGEFENSIQSYNTYKSYIDETNAYGQDLLYQVNTYISVCNNAIELNSNPNESVLTVENMGSQVNSEYGDYAPVLTNDENIILFCSRRPSGSFKKGIDGQYYEDIYFSSNSESFWNQSEVIDKSTAFFDEEVNGKKSHEAPISMSADGNTLYIFKENSVWKSTKNEKGEWELPVRMNQNVNIGEFNPSIFITPEEDKMFIVSYEAPGGMGGRDIYLSEKLEDGTWGEPTNLGPVINTEFDEDAPFLSRDGKTLYFASSGHNTMGGYDIFKTTQDEDGIWTTPMNIGAPLNSTGDDIYYVENESGTIAYYASSRPGSYGNLDLYVAGMSCQNIPTTTIKGYAIYANTHQIVNGVIKITNKTTGEEMGSYVIDANTGLYQMELPPNQTYALEMVVAESKYNQVRPHYEEFFIPEQCVTYNLFQQISINYLKDESGQVYAQKAEFKNAMFDIQSEVEAVTNQKIENQLTSADSTGYIQGTLAFNSVIKAQNLSVTLLNENFEIIRVAETDDNGNFAFENLDVNTNYAIAINQEEAKRLYFGDNTENNSAQINVLGQAEFVNDYQASIHQSAVYFIDGNKHFISQSQMDDNGQFTLSNVPSNASKITSLNENYHLTYNLNIPTEEVAFSAYVVTLNPNNTDLSYTEYVDIIELKESDQAEFANIYFDFDKYFLRTKSENILDNLYAYLVAHPSAEVRLDGHTDWFGTDAYNETLSENRTLSAYKYLVDKGIDPNRLHNAWWGESKPAVDNANADGSDNPENRQLNRRVEIKVDIPEMAALYIQI